MKKKWGRVAALIMAVMMTVQIMPGSMPGVSAVEQTGAQSGSGEVEQGTYIDNEIMYSLTVHYQDNEGNALTDDAVITGKQGETVTPEIQEIEGYTVQGEYGDVKLTEEVQEITIIYEKTEPADEKDEEMTDGAPADNQEADQGEEPGKDQENDQEKEPEKDQGADPVREDTGNEPLKNAPRQAGNLTLAYESGYELSIEGKNSRFTVQTDPIENGRLVITLPAFFELTSTPSSKTEYDVDVDREIIDESDPILGGFERQVITLRYKNVTSTVTASFEMTMTDDAPEQITEAMVRAGAHPDQVPLNIDAELYGGDGSLISETTAEGTSELSDPHELVNEYEDYENIKAEIYKVDLEVKDNNELYLRSSDSTGVREISVDKFHYPYTDMALMVPMDKGNKLKEIQGGEIYYRQDWDKITTEEYEGSAYLVGAFDDKGPGGYYDNERFDNVGETYRRYDFNSSYTFGNLRSIRLIFDDTVSIGETIEFDKPVLLRYTYRGETKVVPVYYLDSYTFPGTYVPEIDEDDKRVLCGNKLDFGADVLNKNTAKLPVQRNEVIFHIEYPYELQPKSIDRLSLGDVEKFDISYVVVDEQTKEEKTVERKGAGQGYEFELSEGEYVKEITISIPELPFKENLSFSVKAQSMDRDIDGNLLTEDKTVYAEYTVYEGETVLDNESQKIDLRVRKDLMFVYDTEDYSIILDNDEDHTWHGGYIELKTKDSQDYMKDYKDAVFELKAGPEIMSKVAGFYVYNRDDDLDEPIIVEYKTNLDTEWREEVESNPWEKNYITLPLRSGEYVTAVRLCFGTLTETELKYWASGGAVCFAPMFNSDRMYYDEDGVRREVEYNHAYKMTYEFTTSTEPAQYMTEENLTVYTTYESYDEYNLMIGGGWQPKYRLENGAESAYRGDTLEADIEQLCYGSDNRYSNLDRPSSGYFGLDPSLYIRNQLIYIETAPGFEITGLSEPSTMVERKTLDNGNHLFKFRLLSAGDEAVSNPLTADLYIRPDAKTENVNPIEAVGISYSEYFEECFPDYPDLEDEKVNPPYQIVTIDNEEYNDAPDNWGISEREEAYGFFYTFEKPYGSDQFVVREVTSSTTQMFATVDGFFTGDTAEFRESQREDIGFAAFIGAAKDTVVNDYTAYFVIPKKDTEVIGEDGRGYKAEYSLYANGGLKIFLDNKEVDPAQAGITVSYILDDGRTIPASELTEALYRQVKMVEIKFDVLTHEDIYELQMPLAADGRSGEDTSEWDSYIGTYNITAVDGKTIRLDPLTYAYNSYRMVSTFALDKYENGNAYSLPADHDLCLYDEEWNKITSRHIDANGSTGVSWNFNADGKTPAYAGFILDQAETDNYLPTLNRRTSDLPSGESYTKTLADGTKLWYIPIDPADLTANNTNGNYDALFIRKPELTAEDIMLAVGESGRLVYDVSQPVNESLLEDYDIRIEVLEDTAVPETTGENVASVAITDDGWTATGFNNGTVDYRLTVTNTQGTTFTRDATITVGNKLFAALPHVGGGGALALAAAGVVLTGGGASVLLRRHYGTRRRHRRRR